jgi:hypothetical protein
MGTNLFFVGAVIAILALGMFIPARRARARDQIQQAWPTAKGTVMSSEIISQPPMVTPSGKSIQQYDVSVKYQFRSGGQLHFGSAVSSPRYLYTKSEADRIAARYPAGEPVIVHHNPEDTRECYLEVHTTAKNYRLSIFLMIIGGIIILYGLLVGLG